MEQSGTPTRLSGAVQDIASAVVSALRSGDHCRAVSGVLGTGGSEDLGVAAVRVLGPDVLLPSVLFRTPPDAQDLAVFRKAVHTFPPPADASAMSVWSHWAMTQTLLRLGDSPADPSPGGTVPEAAWLDDAPWQSFTHQLALLAGLAVPGADSAVAVAAQRRPVDLARGFVRAVRRRDWLQAAGAGRWLTVVDGVPGTLGLGTGMEFVSQMSGGHPQAALHVQAAQLLRSGVRK